MGKQWKQYQTLFWGAPKSLQSLCSHEIKRCLLLGRKVIINLDSILKSREITLPMKVRLVKAMVFPVVMYGCESWTIVKSECQRIDAFELWCWRRLLTVPLTELNWIYDFSSHVRMWELDHKEGWAPKNWYFWTVVLEKTLESPLDCKETNPEYSLERLMLNLKPQYFGHLMQSTDTVKKTLMLGNIEGRRRRGWQMMR